MKRIILIVAIVFLLFNVAFCEGNQEQTPRNLYPKGFSAPYQLSEAVQARANELKVWEAVTNYFELNVSSFPVAYSGGRGLVPLHFYLDILTTVDVMARARANSQGKPTADVSDYDMMFASLCIFVPNKPITQNLPNITKAFQKQLVGMYINVSKRELLLKGMKPVLLEGSMDDLFSIFNRIETIEQFNGEVFNTKIFE